jgi:hypothetical protein
MESEVFGMRDIWECRKKDSKIVWRRIIKIYVVKKIKLFP